MLKSALARAVGLRHVVPRLQTYRGGFFGKLLRAISRFRHQDAQTPPSSLVGRGVGFLGSCCVPSRVSGIRTPRLLLLPLWEGVGFLKLLRSISRFRHQNAQSPPFSPCGSRGQGDEGQKRSNVVVLNLHPLRRHRKGITPPIIGFSCHSDADARRSWYNPVCLTYHEVI